MPSEDVAMLRQVFALADSTNPSPNPSPNPNPNPSPNPNPNPNPNNPTPNPGGGARAAGRLPARDHAGSACACPALLRAMPRAW